jgi:hypothetical protein
MRLQDCRIAGSQDCTAGEAFDLTFLQFCHPAILQFTIAH